MSKLVKLINNPKSFIKNTIYDAVKPPEPKVPAKKPAPKKPAPKPITIKIETINPFQKISHLIHTGEGMTHGPSHLSLWIPEFIRSQEDFIVLVRNMDLYKWVKENYSFINVAYAKNPTDVEKVLNSMAFLRAIYYLSNTGNMIHTLRYNIYEHIFLGHGDSDKSASAHKFFRVYDQIWVAGQAHIDRFKNARFNVEHMSFIKIGRPSIATIIRQNQENWQQRMSPRILYLPTWEGVYEESNYSSVRMSSVMLAELSQRFGLHISMKLHPVTGSRDKTLVDAPKLLDNELLKAGADYKIFDQTTPISDLLLTTNIFICDISAVVSECISANGPIFVYIPEDKDIVISNSDMSYEDYAYTYSSIEELCEKMQKVLNGDDYLADNRKEAMDYILSIRQTLDGEFTKKLQEISQNNRLEVNFREKIIQ